MTGVSRMHASIVISLLSRVPYAFELNVVSFIFSLQVGGWRG